MVVAQERRSLPRHPAQYLVRFYYADRVDSAHPMHTLDLSPYGVCIQTPTALPLGASIKFFMITPTHQVIDVVGRIVHVNTPINSPYRVGVRFTQLSNAHRQLLAHELQNHS